MHIHFLDPYQPRQSPIHELDPRVKFVLALAFIFTSALTPVGAWPVYILLLAVILAVDILSELGLAYVLRRAMLALPFILAALPLVFTAPGPRLWEVSFGSRIVGLSQPGIERFISIALKSWISVQAAIVLAASTPFPELMVAMRAIRLPRLLVAVFGLMWRYLFVLADEVLRLMRARAARSSSPPDPTQRVGGSLIWRARVTGGMAGSLFLRAIERSDRIYTAMLARGYDGEVRTLPLPALGVRHWLILFSGLGFLVILVVFGILFWS